MKIHDFPRDKKNMELNEQNALTHTVEQVTELVDEPETNLEDEFRKHINGSKKSRKDQL